ADAAVDRLRVVDRICADGACVELYRPVRRAAGARAAQTPAGNRLCMLPARGIGALPAELGMVTACLACRSANCCCSPPPSWPAASLPGFWPDCSGSVAA